MPERRFARVYLEPILRAIPCDQEVAAKLGMTPDEVRVWRRTYDHMDPLPRSNISMHERATEAEIREVLTRCSNNARAAMLLHCSEQTVSRFRAHMGLSLRNGRDFPQEILLLLGDSDDTPMSSTAIADKLGISPPWAQRALKMLAGDGKVRDLTPGHSGKKRQWVLLRTTEEVVG